MPYHIKKPRLLEPSNFVYWEGGDRWSDDYSKRKTYVNKGVQTTGLQTLMERMVHLLPV